MTLHSIDIDAALDEVLTHEYDTTAETTTEVAEPYVDAIPVDQLFADPAYQRDLDTRRVDKMADDFKIALVGIIEVSQRPDGRYAILDGQHRWALVRSRAFGSQNENPHVPCRVHSGLTLAQEAALYHQLNTTRRQLTGWDRWVARRGAGDPAVLDIEACAHRHDVTIGMGAGSDILRATKACENVVELGGIPLLDEVLSVIRQTWPDDQSGLDASIIHGLGHVLNTYPRADLDLTRLVQTLTGIVPRQLTARAAAVRELHKGTMDRLAAHVIIERYNTPKGSRLAPFFDVVKPISKTKSAKVRAREEHRERVLAWAVATSWDGRRDRLTPALTAAYEAAHGRQPQED